MSDALRAAEPETFGVGRAKPRGRAVPLTVNLLLVFSVLLNLLLAWKVRSLEASLLDLKAEGVLAAGTLVPPIEARDLNDRPATIDYPAEGPPTVLYVFTPECRWCARNLDNIKELARRAGGDYRFVGLSLSSDNLRDYVADHDFGFPVYAGASPAFAAAYKVGGTPETLVISPEGRVLKKWAGAYTDGLESDVEQYFKVDLPGVSK